MSRDLGIPLMVQRSTLTMLVALTLIGCEGANPNTSSAQARTLPPAPAKPVGPVPAQTVDASRRTAITTAAERVAPAVVTVQTETVQKVPVDFFEYFMGGRTGERRNAGIGQHQSAPGRLEQFTAQRPLKLAHLRADGLNRHIELIGSAGHTTLLGHHPEVIKMFEIKGCTHCPYFQEY